MKRVEWPEPTSTIRRGRSFPHEGVGGDGVEAREPVLLAARLGRRAAGDRADRRGVNGNLVEELGEGGLRIAGRCGSSAG